MSIFDMLNADTQAHNRIETVVQSPGGYDINCMLLYQISV
ncbi:hypothetical protein SAMN05444271_11564 [Halohasta litchfieldiae]|uniref:Uncharacterized protein n=1 Tax=Halohasta litchfieldiae TaxID=1073996 RepID=A0A1H6VDP4_9EURY|nr:hypothetical protein SAMN05444271_11564 [Halohasta litchfieldiae]